MKFQNTIMCIRIVKHGFARSSAMHAAIVILHEEGGIYVHVQMLGCMLVYVCIYVTLFPSMVGEAAVVVQVYREC